MSFKQDKKHVSKAYKREKKKSKSIVPYIVVIFFLLLIFIPLFMSSTGFFLVYGIISDLDPIDATAAHELLDENSFILDQNGNVIEEIERTESRIIVGYDEISPIAIDAILAIEDNRFWDHNGYDKKRIMGAAWNNYTRGTTQGGSTITQQLAKNLYLSTEQTYERKIQELYYAIEIEKQLSKEQILELYLNTIPLPNDLIGIEIASRRFFSKSASELELVEAAWLAGWTRHPSRYTPYYIIHPENLRDEHIVLDNNRADGLITIYNPNTEARYLTVIHQMYNHGYIDDEEFEYAKNVNLIDYLNPDFSSNQSNMSSYFGDLVKDDVIKELMNNGYTREEARNLLYNGGLNIYSTIDPEIQYILEDEVNKADDLLGTIRDADGNPVRNYDGSIQPQTAITIMDPQTGELKAMIGGRGTSGRRILNRATTPRQPGSSIKPIAVYSPALELGHTAASVVDDTPIYYDHNNPDRRWPTNVISSRYRGLSSMRISMRWSSNVAAVQFAKELGETDADSFRIMKDSLEDFGVTTVIRSDDPHVTSDGRRLSDATYSTALGGMTFGISPFEMNQAFNTFANNGVYRDAITFTKVEDRNGNVILTNEPEVNQLISPENAYIMTDLLVDAVTRGYGREAQVRPNNTQIPVAGKTGTTNDRRDVWFVGYTPYYSGAVWVGNDIPQNLGYSSPVPSQLWGNIMTRIHNDLEPKAFERPNSIVSANVCSVSGKLPSELCSQDPRGSQVVSEIFAPGTVPTETCHKHVLVEIHEPSGTLANYLTPEDEIIEVVRVKRDVPFDPTEHGGFVTDDYEYNVPFWEYHPSVHGTESDEEGEGTDDTEDEDSENDEEIDEDDDLNNWWGDDEDEDENNDSNGETNSPDTNENQNNNQNQDIDDNDEAEDNSSASRNWFTDWWEKEDEDE